MSKQKTYNIRGETGFCGAYHEEEVTINYTNDEDLAQQLKSHEDEMWQRLKEEMSVEVEEVEDDEEE